MTHSHMNRRQVLRSLCLASAAFALPISSKRAEAKDSLQWQKLDSNLALISGQGSHVLVGRGSEGILLVDGGYARNAKNLLGLIENNFASKTPPQFLFNTHWHRAQTGCNELLAQSGASIIAHENTKLWLTTTVNSNWENTSYSPLPTQALPTKTFFYDSQQLTFNKQNIEYGYLPQAHTDGDIYIHLPEKNILVAGDVVTGKSYPTLDYSCGGWIGGMINSLKLLIEKSDSETIIISSSMGVCRLEDIKAQLQMCETLFEKIAANYYTGLSFKDFLRSKPSADFDASFGNPDLFLHTAYEGAWGHIRELRSVYRRSRT